MTFLKTVLQKVKEWLNKSDAPNYLSGKNRIVKHERDRQRYLSSKGKKT
tara:strand:+ start:887 stop:1033 length:147 start_codon:yes stop_codon:yes gene_type:complete